MAIKKKETAEQKLLKMIEASSSSEGGVSKTQLRVAKKQSLLAVVKTSNKFLFFGIIIAGIFLANEVKSGAELLGKEIRFQVNQSVVTRTLGANDLIPSIPELALYLSGPKRRSLFHPFEKQEKKVIEVSDENRRIAKRIAKFRLVGISWMDRIETASVMIEDTEKQVTYFLQKGEKLEDIVVKTIYADSAMLGYENEEIIINYDKTQM